MIQHAEALIRNNSVGLNWISPQRLRQLSGRLDDALKEKDAEILVPRSSSDEIKTRISWDLIENAGKIHPGLGMLGQQLKDRARRHYENRGVLPGSWWTNLSQQDSAFVPLHGDVSETGAIVFDLSHAMSLTGIPFLAGHSYGRNIPSVSELTGRFLNQEENILGADVCESADIPIGPFLREHVGSIGPSYIEFLETSAHDEREEYFESLRALYTVPTKTADHLCNTKTKFDRYMNALSVAMGKNVLGTYGREFRELGRLKSTLLRWRCYGTCFYGLCVTAVSAMTSHAANLLEQGDILEFYITLAACTVPFVGSHVVRQQKKEIDHEVRTQNQILDQIRPISFGQPIRSQAPER